MCLFHSIFAMNICFLIVGYIFLPQLTVSTAIMHYGVSNNWWEQLAHINYFRTDTCHTTKMGLDDKYDGCHKRNIQIQTHYCITPFSIEFYRGVALDGWGLTGSSMCTLAFGRLLSNTSIWNSTAFNFRQALKGCSRRSCREKSVLTRKCRSSTSNEFFSIWTSLEQPLPKIKIARHCYAYVVHKSVKV